MTEKSNTLGRKNALKTAEENGFKLNPDDNVVNRILNALDKASLNLGKRYCPCSILKSDDTVCPCKEFRKDKEAKKCHCGLYIRE
jgi:ferredoxin-thioredoxin reductase catalytic subunit